MYDLPRQGSIVALDPDVEGHKHCHNNGGAYFRVNYTPFILVLGKSFGCPEHRGDSGHRADQSQQYRIEDYKLLLDPLEGLPVDLLSAGVALRVPVEPF